MIELPDGISADDLGQWLVGGICLADIGQGFEPAVYDRMIDPDDRELPMSERLARVRVARERFEARHTCPLSNIAGWWPICGSINVPSHQVAVSIERIPARQYRRTLNTRQVKITVPRGWEYRKMRGGSQYSQVRSLSHHTVPQLFEPWYPANVDLAFGYLSEGWLSIAINRRIIVAQDQVGKRMIYYRGMAAATQSGGLMEPIADLTTCRLIHRAMQGRLQWTVEL